MYLQMPRIDCWSSTIITLTALAFGIVTLRLLAARETHGSRIEKP
jgi:hypothetical protein